MARYIDADEIRYHDMTDGSDLLQYTTREYIKSMPTADVVKVRNARWLGKPAMNHSKRRNMKTYSCSLCLYSVGNRPSYNYCPNCGAEMGGGKE